MPGARVTVSRAQVCARTSATAWTVCAFARASSCCRRRRKKSPPSCGSLAATACRSFRAGRAPACPAARCRRRAACSWALADEPHPWVDLENRRMRVQPGVINLDVSRAIAPHGYYYAPDPSSQSVCSIGGNIAENSGGAHCLKYGFTVNHVVAATIVLADGAIVEIGSPATDPLGYDLMAASSAAKVCSASSPRPWCASCERPRRRARSSRPFRRPMKPALRLGDRRGRDRSGGRRDDGRARDRGDRQSDRRRLAARRRRGAAHGRRRYEAEVEHTATRRSRLRRCGALACAPRATTPSAR
jgi:hypothetical protein